MSGSHLQSWEHILFQEDKQQQVCFNSARFKAAGTRSKLPQAQTQKAEGGSTSTSLVQVSRNFWWGNLSSAGFILDLIINCPAMSSLKLA